MEHNPGTSSQPQPQPQGQQQPPRSPQPQGQQQPQPPRSPPPQGQQQPPRSPPSCASIFVQVTIFLVLYICLGMLVYTQISSHFSATVKTNAVVDGFYFCIVTLCTVGYGDIIPNTAAAKIFTVALALTGFGLMNFFLTGIVDYFINYAAQVHGTRIQECLNNTIWNNVCTPLPLFRDFLKKVCIFALFGDFWNKVCIALLGVFVCIIIGTIGICLIEHQGVLDSFYISVISATTIGYGDGAFKTFGGRIFATFWLLFTTIIFAQAFVYLVQARIEKRHRVNARRVLSMTMTDEEFAAEDTDKDAKISKFEFVFYKLKKLGKVDNDIIEISKQFDSIDAEKHGMITLSQIKNPIGGETSG